MKAEIIIDLLREIDKHNMPADKKGWVQIYIESLSESDDLIEDAMEFISMLHECREFYGLEGVDFSKIWELV